jgi:hypothetical protein
MRFSFLKLSVSNVVPLKMKALIVQHNVKFSIRGIDSRQGAKHAKFGGKR